MLWRKREGEGCGGREGVEGGCGCCGGREVRGVEGERV